MDEVTETFVKTIIAGRIKHYIGMGGAALVTYGLLKGTDVSQFVEIASGIAMAGLALTLEWWKSKGEKEVADEIESLKQKLSITATTSGK